MNLNDIVNVAPKWIKKEFIYKRHKKGSLIIHPHEQNDYLYILTAGIAEVYRQTYDGAMLSLYIDQQPQLFLLIFASEKGN